MLLLAPNARAQTLTDEQTATRRALLERAQSEVLAGQHALALELARRAGRLQMTPSVRYFQAQQETALAQWAAAYRSSELCLAETQANANVANREVILSGCASLLRGAREHVGNVRLELSSTPSSLTITLNGEAIPASAWAFPVAVSAGEVLVRATLAGQRTQEQRVVVRAGATVSVPLSLEEAPGASVAPSVSASVSPEQMVVRGPGFAPWLLAGTGAAVAVSALPLWLLRESLLQSAMHNGGCSVVEEGAALECDNVQGAQEAHTQAGAFNVASQTLLWSGAAMVGVGVLWFALAPRVRARVEQGRVVPVSVPGGVGVRGAF